MPIRLRLALWSGAILAAGLLGFSALIYLLAGHTLRTSADQVISGRAHRIDALLTAPPAEHLTAQAQQARLARIAQVFGSQGLGVLLLDAAGDVLAQSAGMSVPPPTCDTPCTRWTGHRYRAAAVLPSGSYYERPIAGGPFRTYVLQRASADRVRTILVGHGVQDLQATLRTLLTLLLAGSAVCLGLVCAAAWFLARRALAPIAAITTTAARIAESADFVDRVQGPSRLDEVGRLAATFNTMLNRLEAVHAAQRRFVSDASHELRAPLTTIRGNAELLLLDPATPPDEREDALRDIAAEAARLARLVDDLLALARGDARLHSRPQPVHLHELLCATAHMMADRPHGPEVMLGQIDAATVYADPDRLEQLLIILLDNARKYTPPDGRIDCSLQADGWWATVTVCDTGIGVHPDDLPHIFERFYRADRARTHEQARRGDASFDGHAVPGTGLGLAIARQIVEEANGTISAESEAGTGTSFIVRFPLQLQRQTSSAAHSTPRRVPQDRETTAQA